MKQTIVIFVGPDRCGKTEISTELSKRIGVPRFKASSEHDAFLSSRLTKRELFLNQLRYADPRVVDLLKQTKQSVIFDRGFPCEAAYSKAFNRETDQTMLQHLDQEWATLGAKIIFCYRTSYRDIVDDLDPSITAPVLENIHWAYTNFFSWTKCQVYRLNVDDEDLNREVLECLEFINGAGDEV